MGSIWKNRECHYCPASATTEDHVVPRALLVHVFSWHPSWWRNIATVPACHRCNQAKKHYRVRCCGHCEFVWAYALNRNWVKEDLIIEVDLDAERRALRRAQQRNLRAIKGLTEQQIEDRQRLKRQFKRLARQRTREDRTG